MVDAMSSPGESVAGNAATLDDDVIREILLRLPYPTVLRFRAVCKTWQRIATESPFLAANADRQPAELLVVSGKPSHLDTIPISLQLQVEDLERRRSHLHYPKHCEVPAMMGSCDGLLLFERAPPGWCSCDYFLCNPVTRQGIWLDLVPRTCGGNFVRMCGFYRHGPSGEHRLLVLANEQHTGPAAHYVFSVTAASEPPRRLGPVADGVVLEWCTSVLNPHVHHRGKLHWTMHPVAESAEKILSFDTVSEAFRLISRPPWPSDRYRYPGDICLLELDGRLALTATETNSDPMELWVLEDYENDQSWSRRFRIDIPPHLDARWAMGTGVPDVILVGSYGYRFAALYHLTEKRIVNQIEFASGKMGTSGHFLFKGSLVPYDFLDPY
ncbi:hypothetical protein ACQ4PT_048366 [Festuca glaucescens]